MTSGGATYDANGNRQSINGKSLSYDFENRLVGVDNVAFNGPNYIGYGWEAYGYSVRGERLLVEQSAQVVGRIRGRFASTIRTHSC